MGWNHQLVLTHIAGGGGTKWMLCWRVRELARIFMPPPQLLFFLGETHVSNKNGKQKSLEVQSWKERMEFNKSYQTNYINKKSAWNFGKVTLYPYLSNHISNTYIYISSIIEQIYMMKFYPTNLTSDENSILPKTWLIPTPFLDHPCWFRQAVGLREGPVVVDPRCRPEVRLGWAQCPKKPMGCGFVGQKMGEWHFSLPQFVIW